MTGSEQAETLPGQHDKSGTPAPLALFAIGPAGSARYLLPDTGVITIGRAATCTIVLDDLRASRSHAALQLSGNLSISDLGSANGTFVGSERLPRGEARALAAGELFSIGDYTLSVRSAALAPPPAELMVTAEALAPRLPSGPSVALRVRAARSVAHAWLETVLADLIRARQGWMMKRADGELAVGASASSAADAVVLERAARERLLSWGIHAIVDSVFVVPHGAEAAASTVLGFLDDRTVLRIARGPLIVRDPAMTALMGIVAKVAASPLSLLILGETGVGKDVIASLVHEISPRAAKRFVSVNCAGLPEPLLESELFGHERGAFTGAAASKPGLLEDADGGTVFLDEVGELPPSVQAKLLRAIESREITRVGGLRPRAVDVRFVAATNRDLVADVATGRFRADLFYRLDGLSLTVPPLRDRPSEILALARHFVEAACLRFGVPQPELSAPTMDALMAHAWPGNIRELRNAMERAVLLVSAPGMIEPVHLNLLHRGAAAPTPAPATSERERIAEALTACAGNQRRAAALLGMPRRTLVRRIAQLSLPRPRRSV